MFVIIWTAVIVHTDKTVGHNVKIYSMAGKMCPECKICCEGF